MASQCKNVRHKFLDVSYESARATAHAYSMSTLMDVFCRQTPNVHSTVMCIHHQTSDILLWYDVIFNENRSYSVRLCTQA